MILLRLNGLAYFCVCVFITYIFNDSNGGCVVKDISPILVKESHFNSRRRKATVGKTTAKWSTETGILTGEEYLTSIIESSASSESKVRGRETEKQRPIRRPNQKRKRTVSESSTTSSESTSSVSYEAPVSKEEKSESEQKVGTRYRYRIVL